MTNVNAKVAFHEVISANQVTFHEMRTLNARAGRTVFPVPSVEALQAAIKVALAGARNIAEVTDMNKLRLPPLDPETVAEVEANAPASIVVLGRQTDVYYRHDYPPYIQIDFRYMEVDHWQKLPENGIKLPDGREVTLIGNVGRFGHRIDCPSSKFKARARDYMNEEQWTRWTRPTLSAPTTAIAPIVEREYGKCVLSGAPLLAYGTVQYRSWGGNWVSYWSRSRTDAEMIHTESVRHFSEASEQVKRTGLQTEIKQLYNLHRDHKALPENLRNRMYHAVHGYERQSIAQMEAIIAELEEVLKTPNPADLSGIDMSQLFGGAAKVQKR